MTAGALEIRSSLRDQFTAGHIALILGVTLVLVGFIFVSQPPYFKISSLSDKNTDSTAQTASRYKPYVAAPQPEVLGASTSDDLGPEVLNEDGTITSTADPGSVLGASTEQLNTDLSSIQVKTFASTPDNVSNYLDTMFYWEMKAIDQTAFESALTSKNQSQINTQKQAMQTMLYYLDNMAVPSDAAQLHKLKIAQYRSAIILLDNFSQADNNPQLVTDQLGIFLASQEQQDQEVTNLRQKYNLLSDE